LERATGAVAGLYDQLVADEIEVDLKGPKVIGYWRRRESSTRDIKSCVPGVIEPWTLDHADLADYLCPHVQSAAGVEPGRKRQIGPRLFCGFHRGLLVGKDRQTAYDRVLTDWLDIASGALISVASPYGAIN
jgi:hypothetical protein